MLEQPPFSKPQRTQSVATMSGPVRKRRCIIVPNPVGMPAAILCMPTFGSGQPCCSRAAPSPSASIAATRCIVCVGGDVASDIVAIASIACEKKVVCNTRGAPRRGRCKRCWDSRSRHGASPQGSAGDRPPGPRPLRGPGNGCRKGDGTRDFYWSDFLLHATKLPLARPIGQSG